MRSPACAQAACITHAKTGYGERFSFRPARHAASKPMPPRVSHSHFVIVHWLHVASTLTVSQQACRPWLFHFFDALEIHFTSPVSHHFANTATRKREDEFRLAPRRRAARACATSPHQRVPPNGIRSARSPRMLAAGDATPPYFLKISAPIGADGADETFFAAFMGTTMPLQSLTIYTLAGPLPCYIFGMPPPMHASLHAMQYRQCATAPHDFMSGAIFQGAQEL